MRRTDHVVVAETAGHAAVIIAQNRTGAQIQADLHRAGWHDVVRFDGGSPFYVSGVGGKNTLGLRMR